MARLSAKNIRIKCKEILEYARTLNVAKWEMSAMLNIKEHNFYEHINNMSDEDLEGLYPLIDQIEEFKRKEFYPDEYLVALEVQEEKNGKRREYYEKNRDHIVQKNAESAAARTSEKGTRRRTVDKEQEEKLRIMNESNPNYTLDCHPQRREILSLVHQERKGKEGPKSSAPQ